jgi:putative membrane protein
LEQSPRDDAWEMETDPAKRSEPDLRFSLANERTFLAWGRTCLTFVATGLVLARVVGPEDAVSEWAGVVLIVLGAVLGAVAYRTYRRNDAAIRSDSPIQPSRLPMILLFTIALAAAVAVALSLRG